jgi:predicted TIM-barrel fold metal-dependent hydrolase
MDTKPGVNLKALSEYVDETWLAKVHEEILDPEIPIVDPHHHFMTWPVHYQLPQMLKDFTSGHNVCAAIHVDARQNYRTTGPEHLKPVGETERMVELAAEAARLTDVPRVCAGIVGYADLMLGEAVEEVLQAHISAGQGRFSGVRLNPFWSFGKDGEMGLSPGWQEVADRPELHAGIAQLGKHGLTLDLVCFAPALAEVARLARRCPDAVMIVNHMGAPFDPNRTANSAAEQLNAWRNDIDAVAAHPNVWVKLGGLGSLFISQSLPGFQAFHGRPTPPSSEELADQYEPLVAHCIERFGPKRCMFESNFPMDKQFASYATLWNAFKRVSRPYSADERRAMLGETAAATYKIEI